MYSRILVAVDESETSKLALQEAIKLAQNQQANLRIVYVSDEFIPAGEGVAVDFKDHEITLRKRGKELLREMVKLASQQHDQVESHLIEITEFEVSISEKILREVDNWNADLIVLGTHGRSGISRLLLGSVAEEVARNASVPVHLVRSEE